MKLIVDCKPGDEVRLVGTVDAVNSNGSVYVVLEGRSIGRVALVPGDVIVAVTGRSPNYGKAKNPRRKHEGDDSEL